eukprot:CAMPEP_0118670266 /NCGR_PEP_ID=MMETSP0785-20121206/21365_1 /TAXON_ID=91992 /ORGANISM="Bolidomonas pacifica, Strain CCMP 1866" /LENGTH=97 /DNA_ID=CAMNT_0006565049 /DNA_START=171 /DNA_END=464 /DNA_ORIENTATION=+
MASDTICFDLLRQHGKILGLITDTRGAISDDFTQLIRLCTKLAAEKNWDAMGASSVQYAEHTYLQMFRRIIGLTIAREGAMWMRRCLGHYIDLRRGF